MELACTLRYSPVLPLHWAQAQVDYNVFTFVAGAKYTFTGSSATSRGATFLFEANDES